MSDAQMPESEVSHAASPPPSKLERTRLWLSFAKFLSGTVVLGFATIYINADLQNKEIRIKEIDIENTHLVKVLEPGIADDLRKRLALAKYFSILSLTKEAKGRWIEFSGYILSELIINENDIETHKKQINLIENGISTIERRDGEISEEEKLQLDQLRWNLIRRQKEIRKLEIASRGESSVILGRVSSLGKSDEVLDQYIGWDGTQFINKDNLKKLRAWMVSNGLNENNLALLLSAVEYEKFREQAIVELNIGRTVQSVISGVPTEAVEGVIAYFRLDGSTQVTKAQQADGSWTITATIDR